MDEKEELFAKAQEMGLAPDKRWGVERLRKLVAGENDAPEPRSPAPPESVPTLKDYIASVEGKYADRDVYAAVVTHPTADERVYPGRYSGIRVVRGPLSVRYSDGTKE